MAFDPTKCAALGAPTLSIQRGLVDNEMRECVACGTTCRWDMTEHSFFGFKASCEEAANYLKETSPPSPLPQDTSVPPRLRGE